MLSQVDYVNVNDMANVANLTEYSSHFKQNIYSETSGVQIPIEIYEGCELPFGFPSHCLLQVRLGWRYLCLGAVILIS